MTISKGGNWERSGLLQRADMMKSCDLPQIGKSKGDPQRASMWRNTLLFSKEKGGGSILMKGGDPFTI